MIKNYLKIAWRNLIKNKASSFINIGGLAAGMAVAMMIGLWIWDEVSYDKNFQNHDHIAVVMQNQWLNNETETWNSVDYPLGRSLRNTYGSNFKYVIMASFTDGHILSYGDKHLNKSGNYMEPGIIDMLSLKMLEGSRNGLKEPASILLSETTAKAIFGNADPMDKTITIDNKLIVKVTGVYQDLPDNCSFNDLTFIAPWQLLVNDQHFDTRFNNPWGMSWFQTFVQIADNADMNIVSAKIKNIKLDALTNMHGSDVRFKPAIFLHPMEKWHLYSEFKNGVNTGGRIQYVWLFGIIGVFVLLLACINFMNLSTARSEKRAREVGIRKAVGSLRSQLIAQFYIESLLIAVFAFLFSLLLVQLSLPLFNEVSGKKISVLWGSPVFWAVGVAFSLITGLIAGSYPALYLSSFQPVKVLKGTFRVGRLAAIPRKVLVITQFTVSAILIIGTIVVFQQIQFAKNRPVGYSRNGLVEISLRTDNINKQYNAVKNDLVTSGAVASMAQSDSPVDDASPAHGGFTWKGKDPTLQEQLAGSGVTADFGKTVGWQIKEGRDFNPSFLSDSSGFIINEAAVKYLGFKNPVGETITWAGYGNYRVIGVIKDMVSQSPYEPIKQTFYFLNRGQMSNITIRINPDMSVHEAISKIGTVFKRYDPSMPFDYHFVDEQYAKKFGNEERIGKLAGSFASLAIFISCLGLFGMASFMAERRVKEIGVRKVLGATVLNLWGLLSQEFVKLVIVSLLIAIPAAYYFMHNWLQQYTYRTELSWWIFAVTSLGAVMVTLLTVSYQSIKAALANPVRSLRSE
jgi:putative ABC transport system permease protein